MSVQRVTSVLVFLAVAVLLVPQTASAKTFRWKLDQGDKFKVEIKQKVVQVINAGGNTMEIPVDINLWMTWEVKSADQEKYVLALVIDRMVMSFKSPNITLAFDSNDDKELEGPAAMIAQMLKPLVGQTITQEMNARGKVLKVDVPDEALKGLNSIPMGQQILSKDQLAEMMKAGAPVFPEGDIDKGHNWTSTEEAKLPAVGTMKTTNKYTYGGEEEVDGKTLDRINIDFEIQFTGDQSEGTAFKVTEQKNSGSIYFDNTDGQIVKSQMKQNMKIDISASGQNMKQEVQQTMTLTMKPVKGN